MVASIAYIDGQKYREIRDYCVDIKTKNKQRDYGAISRGANRTD